ncbi:MAG: hypothetical protein ACHQNV_01800 [Vicinamibacteria bacterium]
MFKWLKDFLWGLLSPTTTAVGGSAALYLGAGVAALVVLAAGIVRYFRTTGQPPQGPPESD